MKRFLIALAVFLTATVSPTFAGYIIIRVLLESGPAGTGPGTGPGSKGTNPPVPFPAGGSGGKPGGRPSSPGEMSGGRSPALVNPADLDPTRSVVVVIPLESDLAERKLDRTKDFHQLNNPTFRKFTFSFYGKDLQASLFVDKTSIQLYENLIAKPAPKKTRHTEVQAKYAAWANGKKDPQLLYDALLLALESGYVRESAAPKDGSPPKDAATFAQELLDVAAESKSLPGPVDRFVKAWGAMSKAVRGPAQQRSDAEAWKLRLDAKEVRLDGHYALVYWDSSPAEVARRTKQLNDNFLAFYLLHATRGVTLPVPPRPLVAVLANQGSAMRRLHHALDGMPVQADAFYAPDHDLLVLSPERLDGVGQTFIQQTQQVFEKLNLDHLLEGLIPTLDASGAKGVRPNDVARATTLAVVEKLVVEEAEIAAVSREGTHQLLFATDQLPRHVTLPDWLTNGAVSAFSRPRGPAYVTIGDDDKPYMHVALTTGYGVPNYVLQRYLRDLDDHKELNADRGLLLEHVLTDAYFAGIKTAADPDPAPPPKKKPETGPLNPPKTGPGAENPFGQPFKGGSGGPPMGPPRIPGGGPGRPGGPGTRPTDPDEEDPAVALRKKRERLSIKAQSTAWALYYYLAHEKPALLRQYVDELNKLPRDLPVDGRTSYAAFVRVFDLSAAAGGPADPEKMRKFATEWLAWMGNAPRAGFDIELVVPDPPAKDPAGGPKGPGGPPGPGGLPGSRP
jgi:hypothetical protein